MVISELLQHENIQIMITQARLDFGLEYELGFVIGAAFLNGLLKQGFSYTKELLLHLRFPIDDVSASMRIDQLSRDWDEDRFARFADKFGINLEKLRDAREIAQALLTPCMRFSKGIRPHAFTTQIAAVSNIFTKIFISNPCLYIGENDFGEFFDYEKGFYFNIAERSRLHYSPKLLRLRPCVYYRLMPRKSYNEYVAPFLCVVPVRLATDLKYSKIYNEKFLVGAVVAERLLRNDLSLNRKSSDPGYILIRKFNCQHSMLDVLCTNNSRQSVVLMIRDEIAATAKELSRAEHRHFWISRYRISSSIGQSLQVLDIFLNDKWSDSLIFDRSDDRQLGRKDVKEMSRMLKRINPDVALTALWEEGRFRFIATFPTVKETNRATNAILATGSDGFRIKARPLTGYSDFHGRTPTSPNDCNASENTPCVICLTPPERNDALRLLLCAHTFCTNCFIETIRHSQEFPIRCVGSNCTSVLMFADMDLAFHRYGFTTVEKMNAFLEPVITDSFEYFLRTSNRGYKKCMTTDCDGLLDAATLLRGYHEEIVEGRFTDAQKRLLSSVPVDCKRCCKPRCGVCGFNFHGGVDCQEFYATNFVYNNEELATWKRDDPSTRRFCPNNECHILMEKAEGCNHIQCTVCHVHFCWLCKDFQTQEPRTIYDHMTKVHGGNGLTEDFLDHLFD